MTLNELIISVKEKNLSKEQLEQYADELSNLFSQMQLEMADLEKAEALFMASNNSITINGEEKDLTVAQKKINWKATKEGQRLIVLKRYSLACKEMLNSLKSRTYRLIF